ncbi:MAG: Rieske 2Fe-2S domain-containing protein [Verrucomicrobia bacterium]|nr:Rieske 2Fe-2S domain-containing protein [Verrucomicrobiota bacterium]
MERRTFLQIAIATGGLVTAAIVAIPVIGTALSPVLRRESGELWQPIGALENFPIGQMTRANVTVPRDDWSQTLREKGLYVLRSSNAELIVFSRNCTDLSCPIVWDEGSNCFFCPCHGGIFSRQGDPMKGPPKRALYRYAARVRNDTVEIDLRSVPPMA